MSKAPIVVNIEQRLITVNADLTFNEVMTNLKDTYLNPKEKLEHSEFPFIWGSIHDKPFCALANGWDIRWTEPSDG